MPIESRYGRTSSLISEIWATSPPSPGIEFAEPAERAEVDGTDRVAVGAVVGVVEGLGHGFLDPGRDRVLEPVGLAVDLVPGHAQLLDQEALNEPVAPEDRVSQAAALGGEQDGPALLPDEVPLAGQALQHLRGRRQGDVEGPGQDGGRDPLPVLLQAFDLF